MAAAWRTAWITGASSGIGRALAIALAARGVKVAASARSADRLAELASAHPGIVPLPLDVTDLSAMRQAARSVATTLGGLDLAVLSAGIWEPMGAHTFSAATAARCMAVNYQGVVNGIEAALAPMLACGAGQLALIASVAGYRGVPRTLAYGPTKAALINLSEGLRDDLAEQGITISLINPGYVATPMTGPRARTLPFCISADAAALTIIRGLEKRKFEIAFPLATALVGKLGRLLPYSLFFWYARSVLSPARRPRASIR
jgi:short-subunit dehydrogenase